MDGSSPTPSTGSTTSNAKIIPRLTFRIRNYDDLPGLERRVRDFGSQLHLRVYIIEDLSQDDIWEIERALADLVTQVEFTLTFCILDEDPKVDTDQESVDSNSSGASGASGASDAGNAGAAGGAGGAAGGSGGAGGFGGARTPLLVYGDCEGMFELMMQSMDLNKDSSIRDHIISKSMCVCGKTNILADDLLPNKTLRDTINRILESGNSSTENAGSTFQIQDMESARCPQPKIPSPASSAASKGELKISLVNEGVTNIPDTADERKAVSAPQQTSEQPKVPRAADVSEVTHESMNVKEPALQGSTQMVEEEVQQKLVPTEAGKKKKKKKVCLPPNDFQWKTPQHDFGAENYMMPMGPPPGYNPYWNGMQPCMDGFMAPYAAPMQMMGYGLGPGPLDMPFLGGMPQDPFPPHRDLAVEFGMGMNVPPPAMKADLRRKRENERRGERDFSIDREFGREVSSVGDVSSIKSKTPNAETDDGITPLLSSVAAGSLECLELLIQAGAKVNISAGGATPLHIACDNGSLEILNSLLKAGADPNVPDEDGVKPIQVAAAQGNRRAVEILFPLTSKIDTIPTWTIDGILEYMQSETKRPQDELVHNSKETNQPKGAVSQEKNIQEVAPEANKRAAEAKSRGDEAFKRKDYHMAIDFYTQAIDLNPSDATFLSNRSLCWIRLGQAEHALADAKACRALRPDWPKACYREGAALRVLQKFDEAANAFYEGVTLDPENKELVNAFREAVEAGRKFHGTAENKS